jgi:hypothetical protein
MTAVAARHDPARKSLGQAEMKIVGARIEFRSSSIAVLARPGNRPMGGCSRFIIRLLFQQFAVMIEIQDLHEFD